MAKKISWREGATPLFWVSSLVLGIVILVTLLGPLVTADPYAQNLGARLLPPLTEGHLFGTDALGRDLASRVVHGGRISLTVALIGMAGSMTIGIIAGLLASSPNSAVRWAIERLIDVQMALPYVILAIVIVSATGTSLGILILLMILAGWASAARVIRSVAVAERAKDYVSAAELIGARSPRVLFRYIGPTVLPVVLTVAPLQASAMIVMESTLSFLGLGIQPPTPSWGGILLEGKPYLDEAWWLTTIPGVAIAVTSAALLGLGTALEQMLSARQRRRAADQEPEIDMTVPAIDDTVTARVVSRRSATLTRNVRTGQSQQRNQTGADR